MKKLLLVLCFLGASTASFAENWTEQLQDSTSNSLKARIQQLQTYLDSAARRKVDPHYIEVPEKPWRVILRYKENGVNVDYENTFEIPEVATRADWKLCFEPPTASSIGFWAGYRGTGVSYSQSLNKNAGRYFSISSTGPKYGFNFRYRRFKTSIATSNATIYSNEKLIEDIDDDEDLASPVWIHSTYINGYYVLNGRRYSQAAAYNQSVIQRRSAGSFLLGATWYQSSLDYTDIGNYGFIIIGNNTGKIQVHQANIGFGYGYNFVPFRGFVINAMAMPTVSVYNRVKLYKYKLNYTIPIYTEDRDDYGTWDEDTRTWSNGLQQRPMTVETDEKGNLIVPDDIDMWDDGTETSYSWFRFNVDLRLGMAYNWKDWFIGFQAQFNNFSYKKDASKVTLTDWYARVSLGVRL